jgi:hypothetical protein
MKTCSHDVLTGPSQKYGWMLCIMTKYFSNFLWEENWIVLIWLEFHLLSLVCFDVNYRAAILLQELTASHKSTKSGVIWNAMTLTCWPRVFLSILLLEAAVNFLHCERNHENHQYNIGHTLSQQGLNNMGWILDIMMLGRFLTMFLISN